ncbi:AGAP003387-PA [Anopheles gambiae str. PEST]|uniref:AGAP003387-PA n=2 Tax=gambiae species complex TaxID=44542 RepID=A0NCX4_ANOGA|nr:AGAP003387-PA [Anopheles gambiae str. PEST]
MRSTARLLQQNGCRLVINVRGKALALFPWMASCRPAARLENQCVCPNRFNQHGTSGRQSWIRK